MNLRCFCGREYEARTADIKRGWAKTCSKRCAAVKRRYGRPDPTEVETGDKLKFGKKPDYTERHEANTFERAVAEGRYDPDDIDYEGAGWDAHKGVLP